MATAEIFFSLKFWIIQQSVVISVHLPLPNYFQDFARTNVALVNRVVVSLISWVEADSIWDSIYAKDIEREKYINFFPASYLFPVKKVTKFWCVGPSRMKENI